MNKKSFAIAFVRPRLLASIAVVTALSMTAASHVDAAEWRIEPRLGIAAEADDNAALDTRTDSELDISGSVIDAGVRFAYSSEVTRFFATPRAVLRNYGGEQERMVPGQPSEIVDFDTNDFFLRFDYNRDTRNSNFGIRGNYTQELVRTGELTDTDLDLEDLDDVPDDSSGRVEEQDTRNRLEVVPNFTYQISNVSSFGMDVRYIDVEYDEGLLADYTDLRSNLRYRRDWSPRTTAILEGTFRQYEAFPPFNEEQMRQPPDVDITSYGISAGFDRRLGETTRLRAVVGLEDTELTDGDSDVNMVGNISLSRRLQTITILAQYRRVISGGGGGGGTLTARDMVSLNFTRRLNDRITAGLGMRAYSTTALEEGNIDVDERDYLQLRAQFIWNLSQTFSLEANYRYTVLTREEGGESANSNLISLGFNWRPTPLVR